MSNLFWRRYLLTHKSLSCAKGYILKQTMELPRANSNCENIFGAEEQLAKQRLVFLNTILVHKHNREYLAQKIIVNTYHKHLKELL